jgi:hypothetical protein
MWAHKEKLGYNLKCFFVILRTTGVLSLVLEPSDLQHEGQRSLGVFCAYLLSASLLKIVKRVIITGTNPHLQVALIEHLNMNYCY